MARGDYAPTWRQFFTGNAMLPRDLFVAAGGFNEEFKRAEDIELGYRLARNGARFAFLPEAIGWHYSERSVNSWRQIARDYAHYDVVMDRLYPELEWLRVLARERRRRHFLSRAGFALLRSPSRRAIGATLATTTAKLAHRCSSPQLAMPLLSFAYSLEYETSLRTALAQARSAS